MALTNKEIRRRYYLRHTEEIQACARKFYLEHGRKRGKPTEEQRLRNIENVRRWREANPEK